VDTEKQTGAAGRGISRKDFLVAGAGAGIGTALSGLVARNAGARPGDRNRADKDSGGYGELSPKQAENDPGTYLALPEGFKYTMIGATGTLMSDGNPTPPAHDGMASFDAPDGVRLVRNHEVRAGAATGSAIGGDAYDPLAGGGTTTLVVDPESRLLQRDFVSLSGTHVNCAGGPTPSGSWLTCEETTAGETDGYSKDHGYIFEVPSSNDGLAEPEPYKAMGRFVHEAVAIDPETGIAYETEDRGSAGFYRFLPNDPQDFGAGGKLQMLAIKGRPNYDTRTGQRVDKPLPVEWVDIENPDPETAEQNSLAVYEQGQAEGGATFARLEGCWYGDGSVFLNSTSGGDAGLGQVWQYRPRGSSGGQLILLFESESADQLDAPDNITVSPRGGLAICEDGDGEQFVRGLTQQGRIFDFALNVENNFEFAGANFSPDGETLFVNVQTPGRTFAIWGPWEDGAL
jgi:secreted PhoX family phosphatase